MTEPLGSIEWAARGERDLVSRTWARAVWVSGAVAVVAGFLYEPLRPLAWSAAFGVSGVLCVANALRSGRFHCAFTGPIFLVGAVVTFARAIGVLTLGWTTIGGAVVIGVVIAWVVEIASGKRRLGKCC